MFCKNFVNFIGKHLCWCLFLTSCRSLACNLFKKRLQHRYFPLRFAKHLRTSMCVRLLLFFAKKNSTWSERRTFSVKFRAKILNICNKDIERGRCRVKNNKIEQKFIFFFLVQKQANLLQSSKNFPSYFFFYFQLISIVQLLMNRRVWNLLIFVILRCVTSMQIAALQKYSCLGFLGESIVSSCSKGFSKYNRI